MTQQAGVVPDADEFTRRTEPLRRELLAHCYRMLGSADEAEDLVQETYLRAWRSYGTFAGRSSLRVWLYRIATNACLTALEHRGRRALPSGVGGPAEDPDAPPGKVEPEVAWLEPIPDTLVTPESADPAAIVAARESLRLALIASLQYLPPRQRAVLILREVLAFPASDVAAMLDTTTAAVKSTLQRARARLDRVTPERQRISEPTDPHARALLDQYVAGFEHADTTALEQALRTDAAIELVGTRTWFSGRVNCLRYLAYVIGSPGDWRMLPTFANGQPAAAAYHRASDGLHRAFGLGVLTVTHTGISRIFVFGGGPTWSPSSASHPSTRARKLRPPPSAEPGGHTPPRRRGARILPHGRVPRSPQRPRRRTRLDVVVLTEPPGVGGPAVADPMVPLEHRALRLGPQQGDLGILLGRTVAVLDQPAGRQQATQRPPPADHVEVDVGAVAGDDVAEVLGVPHREDGEVPQRVALAAFGPIEDAGDLVTVDEDVADLQVAVHEHRRRRPERPLGEPPVVRDHVGRKDLVGDEPLALAVEL
jgi:RNA polymerase sigma-70 factor (ECF subfamily)